MENIFYSQHLFRLSELDDFEVADDSPDIRGWDVIGDDGDRIGRVDELIVDPQLLKVRYMDVKVDRDLLPPATDLHILIPVGLVSLYENDDRVMIDHINTTTVVEYPTYRGEFPTRDYEQAVCKFFEAGDKLRTTDSDGNDFYNRHFFDEKRLRKNAVQ